ncbi:MAG: ATP-binding cassette domain-containing protein, partial [Selenomonas sp.]|nr:ATP-binding cassette domain-containing protein [Selenomonas sp.]
MIVLKDVNKTFTIKDKQVTAVQDVNLTIADKEIYGIIGFSGAGKSTLVRCINLLERPTSGSVMVNGVDMLSLSSKALREQRKKIGMIFQQFNLMPSRTVAQNIALPIENSGLSKEEIAQKVNKLLAFVELEDRAAAYPSQLSGGQKQRVAIARALATDPEILLCDEATSALDPQTTKSILRLLNRLNTELGITVVVITHEMDVIKKLCHRVAVMEHGRVVEENTVYSLFAQPVQPITKS